MVPWSAGQSGNLAQQVSVTEWELESSYEQLITENNQVIRSIVDPQSSDPPEVPADDSASRDILRKLQGYYKSCMDKNLIEEHGATPLVEEIEKVLELFPVSQSPFVSSGHSDSNDRISFDPNEAVDKKALSRTLAHFNKMRLESLSIFWPYINAEDPRTWVIHLHGAESSEIMKELHVHEKSMPGQYTAAVAYTIETIMGYTLTDLSSSPDSSAAFNDSDTDRWLRAAISEANLINLYRPQSMDEIAVMTPSIDWRHFLDNALPSGVRYTRSIIVESPGFQRSLEALLRSAERVELQSYFIWMLIRQLDFLIPLQYIAPIFRSSDAPQERSKHCLWAVREDLSGPLTYFYVQKAIGTSIRSAARSMVDSIRTSFRRSVHDLEWFDDSARNQAIKKIDKIVTIIGCDPKFQSSSSFQSQYRSYIVKENDYFGNHLRNRIWSFKDLFSSPEYPDYVNFGGMGTLMAHEFTKHCFI
ncbi:hypothetical protein BGZ75_000973 [Mortierella antarctica]|nr:hypothetical protein BGZ75_000973 [Mortierella antarctica]